MNDRSAPLAQIGECAYLEVLEVGPYGAFLDWGLRKNLLLPHSEQAYPVKEGRRYVVFVYMDEQTDRPVCSTKLHHHLPETSLWLKPGQEVELLIAAKSPLGYKAVIDGNCLGLIYEQELSQPLQFGERMRGWVKAIRDDGKIDLSINNLTPAARDELSQRILDKLKERGGRLPLSDKSSAEDIHAVFKVSKSNYKSAIGGLKKQGLIRIDPGYIELT